MRSSLLCLFVAGCSADIPVIEKLFCRIAQNPSIEPQVENATCKEMVIIEPKITDTMCRKYFEQGWAALKAQCPSSALEDIPSPDDIEKMIEKEFCIHANDTSMENEVATAVCTIVNQAAPQVPVAVCELTVKKGWSELAAECPKQLLNVGDSPIDVIEKAFCKISKDAAVENKAETITCQEIQKIDPSIPDGVCKKFFEKGWATLSAKCPSDAIADYPSPADIAKWVEQEFCSHAGDSSLESEFVTTTCTVANQAVPQVPVSVCETALKQAWTELAAKCPKQLGAISPVIEKAFCMVAKNKAIEDKAEMTTCKVMENIEPKIPDKLCKVFFEKGWSILEAKCPDSLTNPSPADIAKWVEDEFCSHAGDTSLEDEFTTTACTLANKAVPQIPVSICEMSLKEGWTELATQCPATTTPKVDVLVV